MDPLARRLSSSSENRIDDIFDCFLAGMFILDEGLGVDERGLRMNPEPAMRGSFL